jgi:LTXXQ motif family protein
LPDSTGSFENEGIHEGYGDIFTGGIFSPYGFNDLAGYLPGATSVGHRTRSNVASASEQMAETCGNDSEDVADWPIHRIRQLVSPNDQQSMALDDLANASVQAAQIIKTSCPTSVSFTPTGRLEAMQQRIEGMEQAIAVVRGPLDTFYGDLTDDQKAKLDAANQETAQRNGRPQVLTQSCNKNAGTDWPEARIEAAVRPNEEQLGKIKALENAAMQAAEQLAASCPSEMPTTPPARLAVVLERLDVMLGAVKSVRVALEDFYGDLSDEEKAQFNRIGQSRTAERY